MAAPFGKTGSDFWTGCFVRLAGSDFLVGCFVLAVLELSFTAGILAMPVWVCEGLLSSILMALRAERSCSYGRAVEPANQSYEFITADRNNHAVQEER